MVAIASSSHDISKFNTYCTRTETLNDWISTIRQKKGVIRRQRKNRDLRVAAVLSLAIRTAESQLKRIQCERSQRWAQVRAQYEEDQQKLVTSAETVPEEGGQASLPGDSSEQHQQYQPQDQPQAASYCRSKRIDTSVGIDQELAELLGLDNLFNDLNQIKTVVAR